jgi:transposase
MYTGCIISTERGEIFMTEVAMQTTIITLYKKGYSKTHIANEVGVDRKTVRKVVKNHESGKEVMEKKPHPSYWDPHKTAIESGLSKGLTLVRIYQDLQASAEITASYSGLRDYVNRAFPERKTAYMVLASEPGEEAQVDYGYIGTIPVDGKRKKAWVFVMTLSHSRYMYAEIAFTQSVQSFIQSHVNAFRYFGGVPVLVKIDNLKAGIIEADFYEPLTQRTYAEFASHYGFLPFPCQIKAARQKGKVERGVGYVKDNCFKARGFASANDAKSFLSGWLETVANVRKHGTTRKMPATVFKDVEKAALLPLPGTDFIFSKSQEVTGHFDCHISYGGNYYSMPHAYVGLNLKAIEVNNILKIYHKDKEIALHTVHHDTKGSHYTDKHHYPRGKNISSEELLSSYKSKMGEVGGGAVEFCRRYEEGVKENSCYHRTLSGIISLRRKYPDPVVDQACRRACYYGNISYRAVKKICEAGYESLPLPCAAAAANKPAEAISLAKYREMTALGVME